MVWVISINSCRVCFTQMGLFKNHETRLKNISKVGYMMILILMQKKTTPWKFNSSPLKMALPQRKGSSSNHHSGVNSLLNFGGLNKKYLQTFKRWNFEFCLILKLDPNHGYNLSKSKHIPPPKINTKPA